MGTSTLVAMWSRFRLRFLVLHILPCRLLLVAVMTLDPGVASAQNAVCAGHTILLDLSIAATPHVRIRLGAHEGNFLIDTGATASSVDARTFGLGQGSKIRIEGSSFPTITGGDFAVFDWGHAVAPRGGLAGVIGTDFLSLRVLEFHYDAPQPYLVVSDQHCSARRFEDAGFISISQDGYYTAEPKRLRSNTPNIPVMFLRIASVVAPAQIDSGFGERDGVRGVVQINESLLRELRNAGITLNPANTVPLINTDCRGNSLVPVIWRARDPLQMTTREGETVFEHEPALLQAKSGSIGCGGIATSLEPMAQIGAAYLERWGTFVLDPFNERVWVRKAVTSH
jgi:hypothetical protein